MELQDSLRACLQALESRYPENLVEVNKAVLGERVFQFRYRSTEDIMAWLQQTEPTMLEELAYLVINAQHCVIYLTGRSEQIPAFLLRHRGKMPDRAERNIPSFYIHQMPAVFADYQRCFHDYSPVLVRSRLTSLSRRVRVSYDVGHTSSPALQEERRKFQHHYTLFTFNLLIVC
ncbi:hypothetical protein [Ktedonospora formicarum]|uniref:Uncharacterized protein n=1 Tax=Ktedonospora formicarum TaxID=2778364 RepID=A0A8J3I598_9CHLR|nr:hypothetical protein [Ktedonospora formicarum]GHO48921.1 hypothetical protein KSX_70840 [Ktedonospora formicarum]